MFDLCRNQVIASKMFEKHLWKSDVLSKDAGRWPASLLTGALSGLIQVLATESPLKMMKNAFYFTLKALFVLKIFKFLPWLFGYV